MTQCRLSQSFGAIGALALAVIALTTTLDAAWAQNSTALVPGTPYAAVRQTLQAQGYQPLVFPRPSDTDLCGDICRTYPEFIDCSLFGVSTCRFAYRAPDGSYLVGNAGGETPDQLTLEGIASANGEDSRGIDNLLAGRPELFGTNDDASPASADGAEIRSQVAVQEPATPTSDAQPPNQAANTSLFVALIIIGLALYLLPTIIAFSRQHRFRWPIFAFNVGAGWSGIGWIWTLVWSVWPQRSAMVDPLVGDATGIGPRS